MTPKPVCIPTCHEFTCCGNKKSCFDGIPANKECWEFNGSIGGDCSCKLFADMKLTDCKQCFFYRLKMKVTESVDILKSAYAQMKMDAEK